MNFALAFALTTASGLAIDLSATTDASCTVTTTWDCEWHDLLCQHPRNYLDEWREACPCEWVQPLDNNGNPDGDGYYATEPGQGWWLWDTRGLIDYGSTWWKESDYRGLGLYGYCSNA